MTDGAADATPLPRTVGEAVAFAVQQRRGGTLVFHMEDGTRTVDMEELYAAALRKGAHLVERGLQPGQPVGLVGPNEPGWAEWAFAIWVAGGALVPLPAPVRIRDRSAYADQLTSLSDALGTKLVVAHPRYAAGVPDPAVAVAWDGTAPALDGPVDVDPSHPSSIRCTSGSTAVPKGIVNSHATTMSRVVPVETLLKPEGGPPLAMRWLSWFPFFHTMGLMSIVQVLQGVEIHQLAPERFVRDPALWLRLVGETRATMTGAASSGWAAALRAVERRPEGVDLSSLFLAMFALEMVDPDVVDRLIEVGGRFGLKPEAVVAMYGLSEAGGTMTPFGTRMQIDAVDLETLVGEGRAVPPQEGRPVKRVASCGRSSWTTEVRIMGPDGPVGERTVGEIQLRGTTMDGYLNNRGEDPLQDGWFRTGDLGYLADEDLYVTGRSKEMVVHQGRNYYPQDIEWAVERRLGVAAGTVVAFAPTRGAEGEVVVAIEAAEDDDAEGLPLRVRAAVTDVVGITPRDVVVVAPGALPKAANGKAQRLAARAAHDAGELVAARG